MLVQAVIDRFEEQQAVVLLGSEEIPIRWPRTLLPIAAREGDLLQFIVKIDAEATDKARSAAQDMLQQILKQQQGR